MDISKYDFQFEEIKNLAETLKELTRKAVNQEDVLRLSVQDRILGAIDNEALEKIVKESDGIAGKCGVTRLRLYEWCELLSNIRQELMRVASNAGYAVTELDTTINIARIFSDI